MRFDHPLIFVTDTGELLHADMPLERVGGQKERVTWKHLISTYSAIADRARTDWLHTYVYLQSERNDPLSETKKVAMGKTNNSSNLHVPACWYGEVRRINKHLLPIPERKLVIASREDLEAEIGELLAINGMAILYGLHELEPGLMRYRNISDVPFERLGLCVNSLFNTVIILNKTDLNHPLVNIAKQHGIPVEELTSKGGVICTHC